MALEKPRARYRQVADDLREAIARGTYAPGAALPSQPQLARKYGLTQTSIGKAIGLLEGEGLIHTQSGIGSFGRPPHREADPAHPVPRQRVGEQLR